MKMNVLILFFVILNVLGVIATQAEEGKYPREIKWGNTILKLEKKPERILVSFVTALEVLEKLVDEKKIVGCPKMALDSKYSNCVEFAKKIPFVFDSPDMEIIEKCNPDVVILASFNDPKILDLLKTFKRQYIVLDKFDTYEDICKTIQFLGELTGEEQKAEQLLQKMKSDLRLIQENWPVKKLKVMSFGYNSYTAGSGTTLSEMMTMAGCENVAATFGVKGHKQVTYEEMIKINPNWVIIYSVEADAKEKFLLEMKKTPAYEFVTAFNSAQVIVISPAYGTASSQYFVDGVKELSLKIKNIK